MSAKYPGGFITKNPVAPTTSAASGVWTLDQAMQYTKAGTWPLPGAWVDDVFSAYTYTGNGSTQTITNGIDLSGQGGLVWTKCRSTAYTHCLTDTVRGVGNSLDTADTAANDYSITRVSAFGSTGFTMGGNSRTNSSADTYISWTFRKAPKFFDVVTYTGNGTSQTIAHNLGQVPGMIIVKDLTSPADWQVYHRSLTSAVYKLVLNTTAAETPSSTTWNATAPTASVFSVGSDTKTNNSGDSYVAYLFAHDTATDGIIQCGSFTTDGSGSATVTLGWEPQYVITKLSSGGSGVSNWTIHDSSRSFTASSAAGARLAANNSNAEDTVSNNGIQPNSTGFKTDSNEYQGSTTYIYLAIRRPNKPPTTGTQVYNAIARTGTGAAATVTGVGFAPDLVIPDARNNAGMAYASFWDRLRGPTNVLVPYQTAAEAAKTDAVLSLTNDGMTVGVDSTNSWVNAATTYINWFFKRAPGVFDVVCYTGNGTADRALSHSLGVAPEMAISKRRDTVQDWRVQHNGFSDLKQYLVLNTTAAVASNFNNGAFTSSTFVVGVDNPLNNSNTGTYVAYLFASKAGISKVGSYTGNGSSQTINCGFTTGARFVLIKRTDSTGDWYCWDVTRGIVAGNDPHLSLNSTAAEVTTDDTIDPDTSGFIVNQLAATNVNVTSATYIYLSFA